MTKCAARQPAVRRPRAYLKVDVCPGRAGKVCGAEKQVRSALCRSCAQQQVADLLRGGSYKKPEGEMPGLNRMMADWASRSLEAEKNVGENEEGV